MNGTNKLCLGTVKLGTPNYGFSVRKEINGFDAIDFLNQVRLLGIDKFDTSPRYGESETILGQYIDKANIKPFISTKVDNLLAKRSNTVKKILASTQVSLDKLNLEKLDILYLHQNKSNIINDPYVLEGLIYLKDNNLCNNIGVSIYTFKECECAIKGGIFDYIQVPINICDIGFYNEFIKNSTDSVKFVARSILFQGMLVNYSRVYDHRLQMSLRSSSSNEKIVQYFLELDRIAFQNNCSTLQLAISFVSSLINIDHYIIGSTSIENLKMDIKAFESKLASPIFDEIYELSSQSKNWSNLKLLNKIVNARTFPVNKNIW